MASVIGKFFLQFLDPLAIVGLFLFVSVLFVRSKSKGAQFFLIVALLLVAILGNGFFSNWLVRSMEWRYMPVDVDTVKADAIVVLVDGVYPADSPRLRVELGEEADRLLFATALLQRGAAKGILLVGDAEETTAAQKLLTELGLPEQVIFQNQSSDDIVEMVSTSVGALQVAGAKSILLVSSAMEMDRMRFAFEQSGLEVIPAPCDYHITKAYWDQSMKISLPNIFGNLMPDSESFARSVATLSEYLSLAFYRIRAIF